MNPKSKTVVQKHKKNFETLIRAIKEDKVALMECTLNSTGEKVAVLTVIYPEADEFVTIPFAMFLNGNPYELLTPPEGMKD